MLVPEDLEAAKLTGTAVFGATLVGVEGNYDRVNRLCAQIADRYGWGIVNVNLRAYYGEGSKTVGFEMAEQLGWTLPGHVVAPMAGGSLVTKVETRVPAARALSASWTTAPFSLHGAQPAGCVADRARVQRQVSPQLRPVKPDTIVRSLAIGDPADGRAAVADHPPHRRQRRPTRRDPEVLDGIRLLAETEGSSPRPPAGPSSPAARELAEGGAFADDRARWCC